MEMRPVVVAALIVCLLVAVAPWFSGGQEPIALMVSGMVLLLAALLAWLQPSVRRLRLDGLVVSYSVLLVLGALSLAWSANRYSTGLWIVEWLLVALAFRVAYVVSGERHGKDWLISGYVWSALTFCVIAVFMFLTVPYPRLTGLFYWPNPAAAYLIPAILIALDKLRLTRGRGVLLWTSSAVALLACFLLTDSRAATLVLGLVTALFLLVVRVSRIAWTRIVFVVLAAILSSLLLSDLSTITTHRSAAALPGSRFAEAAGGESKSLRDRFYYLASAARMWADHPVLGVGAGTYGDVHPQYQQRVVSAATSAHNVYVQTAAELGSFGALALLGVLLALAGGIARGVAREPGQLAVALGLLGLLLHFGLDIDAHYPALAMLCGLLAGITYTQRSAARAKVRLSWPAVAAVLLVPLVGLYQSDTWAGGAKAASADEDQVDAAAKYALANRGVLFNPDNVGAEGIALYALGAAPGPDSKAQVLLALQRAREAERLDPHDGQHHQLEGRLLAFAGDSKAAEAQFRRALALDPYNHPDYALDLAGIQLRLGETGAAIETAQAMLGQYPAEVVANRNADPTLRHNLSNLEALVGDIYLQRGDLRDAGMAARRALHHDPQALHARALMHAVDKASQIPQQ